MAFVGLIQILEIIRHFLLNIATLIAKVLPFDAQNILLVIYIAISIFIASKILKDNTLMMLGLAGGLFYFLKIYGA